MSEHYLPYKINEILAYGYTKDTKNIPSSRVIYSEHDGIDPIDGNNYFYYGQINPNIVKAGEEYNPKVGYVIQHAHSPKELAQNNIQVQHYQHDIRLMKRQLIRYGKIVNPAPYDEFQYKTYDEWQDFFAKHIYTCNELPLEYVNNALALPADDLVNINPGEYAKGSYRLKELGQRQREKAVINNAQQHANREFIEETLQSKHYEQVNLKQYLDNAADNRMLIQPVGSRNDGLGNIIVCVSRDVLVYDKNHKLEHTRKSAEYRLHRGLEEFDEFQQVLKFNPSVTLTYATLCATFIGSKNLKSNLQHVFAII